MHHGLMHFNRIKRSAVFADCFPQVKRFFSKLLKNISVVVRRVLQVASTWGEAYNFEYSPITHRFM
jgi:hypothetical protein